MTKKNNKTKEEFKKAAKSPAAKMTSKKKPVPKKPAAKKPKKTEEQWPGTPSSFGRGGCWGTGRGGMGW